MRPHELSDYKNPHSRGTFPDYEQKTRINAFVSEYRIRICITSGKLDPECRGFLPGVLWSVLNGLVFIQTVLGKPAAL